ncbi:MAG: peptidoglycan-binding protein [Patescibacteria group bacterium]
MYLISRIIQAGKPCILLGSILILASLLAISLVLSQGTAQGEQCGDGATPNIAKDAPVSTQAKIEANEISILTNGLIPKDSGEYTLVGTGKQSFTIDLGKAYLACKIVLYPLYQQGKKRILHQVQVEGSSDNVTWTSIVQALELESFLEGKEIILSPSQSHRYIRVWSNGNSDAGIDEPGNPWVEVMVYGAADQQTPTSTPVPLTPTPTPAPTPTATPIPVEQEIQRQINEIWVLVEEIQKAIEEQQALEAAKQGCRPGKPERIVHYNPAYGGIPAKKFEFDIPADCAIFSESDSGPNAKTFIRLGRQFDYIVRKATHVVILRYEYASGGAGSEIFVNGVVHKKFNEGIAFSDARAETSSLARSFGIIGGGVEVNPGGTVFLGHTDGTGQINNQSISSYTNWLLNKSGFAVYRSELAKIFGVSEESIARFNIADLGSAQSPLRDGTLIAIQEALHKGGLSSHPELGPAGRETNLSQEEAKALGLNPIRSPKPIDQQALVAKTQWSNYALAEDCVFHTDLKREMGGEDVRCLQIVLNTYLDTAVAIEGPGSPGQETDYFGPLTENAVIRFQEKYTMEILTPLGLTQGTGFVGSSTRTKLNSLTANIRLARALQPRFAGGEIRPCGPNECLTEEERFRQEFLEAIWGCLETSCTGGIGGISIRTLKSAPRVIKAAAGALQIMKTEGGAVRLVGYIAKYGTKILTIVDKHGEEVLQYIHHKGFDPIRLSQHFKDHGARLGVQSEVEYEWLGKMFMNRSAGGTLLTKTRANGDIIRFDTVTEHFGIKAADGRIKTFYKPDPAIHGYPTNYDYFLGQ